MRKRFILFSLLVLFFALLGLGMGLGSISAAPAVPRAPDAATIYVRPGGDDVQCNGTVDVDHSAGVAPDCAVQTIGQGITLVDSGGTVYVAAGTYSEVIDIDKSLRLEGNGSADDANASRIDATAVHGVSTTSAVNITDGTSHVTITGFRFEGDGQQPPTHSYLDGENALYFTGWDALNPITHITVTQNAFVNTDRAIVTGANLQDSVISDNQFEGITDWWVILVQTWDGDEYLDNLQIVGNEIRNSTSVPIALMDYGGSPTVGNVLVEGNYIHDNDVSQPRTADHIYNREGQAAGIVARYGWQNLTIRNNVVVDNLDMSGVGIWGTGDGYANLTIEGNVLRNNTGYDRYVIRDQEVDPSEPSAGIKVRWITPSDDGSTWSIHDNTVCHNEVYEIDNGTTNNLDATGNWWGHNPPVQSDVDYTGTLTVAPSISRTLTAAPALVDPAGGGTVSVTVTYDDGAAHTVPDGVVVTWTVSGGTAVPTTTVSGGSAMVEVTDDATPGMIITAEGCCGFSQQITLEPGRVRNQDTGEIFSTIQSAIDDADTQDGHVIVVEDGVYTGNVTVNKSITLTSGTGNYAASSAIISGTVAWSVTAPDVNIWGFRFENITSPANGIITGNSDNLTLYDNSFVNVDTAPVLCYTPGVQSGWVIDGNYINGVTGTNMSGLFLDGLANSVVSYNVIEDTAYGGIIVVNAEGIHLHHNTIRNTPRKGIQISGTPSSPAETILEHNTITNTVTTDDNDEGAISLYADVENITIQYNELTDNYRGVVIRHLEAGSVSNSIWVHDNNIYNNRAASGLVDDPGDYQGGVLNAAYNWWGDASGPGGEGPGSGEAITANVAYCPWLDAAYPGGSPTSDGNLVTNLDTGEMFCTIQSAIDDPDTWSGHTIVADPGVYTETVVIDKGITLRGATYTDNKSGYAVPTDYAWDPAVESIISAPNPFQDGIVVDITASNVTLEGFVIQSLYSTGSGDSGSDPHLVRVQARYNPIDNVVVQNNVIGPNTHVTLQDGTMGRMGLYLSMPNYGDDSYDITNSTFAGNKIFGCEGNGNNVFIWGGAENYNPAAQGDLSGTVIEDNEIYGSHRSGIEIAGSADNLTIRDNEIHGNSGLPTDDPTALKYGNGILIIRMGSDKTSTTAEGPAGLTITGNYIYNNEKNGIYMGPFNSAHVISGNFLVGNGWDGIRIDLEEAYHSGVTPVYSATENITLHHNDITRNSGFGAQVIGTPTNGFVLDAEDNWFGCNYGPGVPGPLCTGSEGISGIIDADPWLVLDLTLNPATILDNETSDLRADLTWNSDGVDTSAAGHLPDGMATAFFASSGIVSPGFDHTVSGVAHSVFTPTVDGTAVISTLVDAQTVTATITISQSWKTVYLPLVMNDYTPMPDLRVTGLTIDPASGLGTGDPVTITVTVENVGDAAADPFWVDLYDNPDPVPTEANQPWNMVCSGDLLDCYGIAWYVDGGLNAGASITLSSLSGYEEEQTHWLDTFVDGGTHELYAFADSWNWTVAHGAVEERNEGVDNRFGPVTVDIATTRSFVAPEEDEIIIPWRSTP